MGIPAGFVVEEAMSQVREGRFGAREKQEQRRGMCCSTVERAKCWMESGRPWCQDVVYTFSL